MKLEFLMQVLRQLKGSMLRFANKTNEVADEPLVHVLCSYIREPGAAGTGTADWGN